MTFSQVENLVKECVEAELSKEDLHNVYWGLSFFDACNFSVILKDKYNIMVN